MDFYTKGGAGGIYTIRIVSVTVVYSRVNTFLCK